MAVSASIVLPPDEPLRIPTVIEFSFSRTLIRLVDLTPGLDLKGLDATGIGRVVDGVRIADGVGQVYSSPDRALKEHLLNRADLNGSIQLADVARRSRDIFGRIYPRPQLRRQFASEQAPQSPLRAK